MGKKRPTSPGAPPKKKQMKESRKARRRSQTRIGGAPSKGSRRPNSSIQAQLFEEGVVVRPARLDLHKEAQEHFFAQQTLHVQARLG